METPLPSELAPPPPEPDRDAIALFRYFTREFRGFLTHMEQAVNAYAATGQVPEGAVYAVATSKAAIRRQLAETRGEPKRTRAPRKPTPFNFFVKAKIQELRDSGVQLPNDTNNNGLFKMAVDEWGKLSAAEKKAYTEEFKATHVLLGEDDAAAAAAGEDDVDIEGEEQEPKRRASGPTQSGRKKQKMVAVPIGRPAGSGDAAMLAHLEAATAGGAAGPDMGAVPISLSELVSGGTHMHEQGNHEDHVNVVDAPQASELPSELGASETDGSERKFKGRGRGRGAA